MINFLIKLAKKNKKDIFTFDEKTINNTFTQTPRTAHLTTSDVPKDTEAYFEESRLAKLIEEEFLKEVSLPESLSRITSFGYNIDQKISKLYPAFQKYTNQNITFLHKYLRNLQLVHKKEESSQVMNVREKMGQIQPKSINEYIQVMQKLFNFYAVKKIDKIDIAKENIKMKFSQRSYMRPEENEEIFEGLYNFKLPKESKIMMELRNKKEKIMDIEEINVDDSPMKRKKIDWMQIRKTKKSYHSIKVETDNSIRLSRNRYCE